MTEGWLELAVADDGPGIPPEVRERIFEPLFSTRPFGVGLGLPLVRRIVEQHGGELVVESSPGAGARFTIRLPVALAAGAGASAAFLIGRPGDLTEL